MDELRPSSVADGQFQSPDPDALGSSRPDPSSGGMDRQHQGPEFQETAPDCLVQVSVDGKGFQHRAAEIEAPRQVCAGGADGRLPHLAQDMFLSMKATGRFQTALQALSKVHEEEVAMLQLKVAHLESQMYRSPREALESKLQSKVQRIDEPGVHQMMPRRAQTTEIFRDSGHYSDGVSSPFRSGATASLMLLACKSASPAPTQAEQQQKALHCQSDQQQTVIHENGNRRAASRMGSTNTLGAPRSEMCDADGWLHMKGSRKHSKQNGSCPKHRMSKNSHQSRSSTSKVVPMDSSKSSPPRTIREDELDTRSLISPRRKLSGPGQESQSCNFEDSCAYGFRNRDEQSVRAGPIAHWERLVLQTTHQAALNEVNELSECWQRSDAWVRQIRWNNPSVDLWEFGQKVFHGRTENRRARVDHSGADDIVFEEEEGESFSIQQTLRKARNEGTLTIALIKFIEHRVVLDPQSRVRILWAAIGVLLMIYDLVMMPMQAFELPETALSRFVAWFSQVFWTLDIFLSFVTGIYINTELCTRLTAIARSYAKSWLFFDVMVVGPIWVVMCIGADDSTVNSLQAFKYVRMLRFLRLLRLAKFSRMLGEALAGINSPVIMLVLGMVKLMCCMAIVSHVNACLWYAAGQGSSDGWTQTYERASTLYQYLAAMHWALTQFQGTSEIVPGGSMGERAYAVITVLLSMLILSTFVSSLTNMMMQLQALHDERTWQHRAVKGYLSNHSISHGLSTRVKKYIEWKQKYHRNHQDDEDVLKMMPLQLMMDLQDEVRGPVLTQHRFLRMFRHVYPRLTRRICHVAVQQLHPAPDELIFSAQESSFRMYFVLVGELRYTVVRRKYCSTTVRLAEQSVLEEQYLSEAALWIHWQHRGDLVVMNFAQLLTIVTQQFQNLVSTHPPAFASCILYARRYIEAMKGVEWWSITDVIRPEVLMAEQDHQTRSTKAAGLTETANDKGSHRYSTDSNLS